MTDYGLFAIGGEVPFMIYDAAQERVRVLSGIGRAPLSTEAIEWYYANGIPDEGSYLPCLCPARFTCASRRWSFSERAVSRKPSRQRWNSSTPVVRGGTHHWQ